MFEGMRGGIRQRKTPTKKLVGAVHRVLREGGSPRTEAGWQRAKVPQEPGTNLVPLSTSLVISTCQVLSKASTYRMVLNVWYTLFFGYVLNMASTK